MPVTRSANKKMRRDVRKHVINVRQKRSLKDLLKKAHATRAAETVKEAISKLDKAVKNKLVHKNTAARIKSQLMKEVKPVVVHKKASKSAVKAKVAKAKAAKASKSTKARKAK